MRSLLCLLIPLLLISAGTVSAESFPQGTVLQKDVLCYPDLKVLKEIEKEFGEHPIFLAEIPGGFATLLYNGEKHTFSWVDFDGQRVCVVDYGVNGVLNPRKLDRK